MMTIDEYEKRFKSFKDELNKLGLAHKNPDEVKNHVVRLSREAVLFYSEYSNPELQDHHIRTEIFFQFTYSLDEARLAAERNYDIRNRRDIFFASSNSKRISGASLGINSDLQSEMFGSSSKKF